MILRWILAAFILLVLGLMAYVRFAPVDPKVWHRAPDILGIGDHAFQGGFGAVRAITTTPEGLLEAIDRTAVATPRTVRIAGSVADGMVTYETRSAGFGFPDYTTAAIITSNDNGPSVLQIIGRQRFGIEDLGVNQARIESWLDQLGPLIVAP